MNAEYPLRTEDVTSFVASSAGTLCRSCGRAICGHEALLSLVLGFKGAPRCLDCLASDSGRQPDELRLHVRAFARARDCLAAGWTWADREEAAGPRFGPACPTMDGSVMTLPAGTVSPSTPVPEIAENGAWDAGDMGCGDLVLELRGRLRAMGPGKVLKVTARDLGAPEDLPAWCGLTGHKLLHMSHPDYWIQRKES